jgi:hypothetical protein
MTFVCTQIHMSRSASSLVFAIKPQAVHNIRTIAYLGILYSTRTDTKLRAG